jgi:hypothetical protein
MGNDLEETLNLATYERVKGELAAKYPKGHFVGIAHGKVVADGANLDELIPKLRALGLDPKQVLGVQAGIEVPQYAIIFSLLGRAGNEPGVR